MLAFRTVLRVAICSLLVLSMDLSFRISSRRPPASRSMSKNTWDHGEVSVPRCWHSSMVACKYGQ